MATPRVFISHSSSDRELVAALVNALETSFRLRSGDIRCTSLPGYRLDGGRRTPDTIRSEIEAADLILAILPRTDERSDWVRFELGAAWALNRRLVPILTDRGPEDLPEPLRDLNALRAYDEHDILQLIDDVAAALNLVKEPTSRIVEAARSVINIATRTRSTRSVEPGYSVASEAVTVTQPSSADAKRGMSTFTSSPTMIDYRYVDAIILGPRASGKTSIIQSWTSPWTQITSLRPTLKWRIYERDIHEFAQEHREGSESELGQTPRRILRLRAHDFPGEDSYRLAAIRRLAEAEKKTVLVLVMQVEYAMDQIECVRDNALYYNSYFAELLMTHLRSVSATVAKVIVVFNKCDKLPVAWTNVQALTALTQANGDALYQIHRVFGEVDCLLTSAVSNMGLIHLLGKIGAIGVSPLDEPQRYGEWPPSSEPM